MPFSFPDKVPRGLFWVSLALFLLVIFSLAQLGPIGKRVLPFGFLYSVSFVLLFLIYKGLPDEWPLRKQFIFIFCISVLCRFFFVAFPESYDVNRYIWEGYVYNQGFNPYLHAPSDPVFEPIVNGIWNNINHKDATACYPPMIILFFGLLASISQNPLFFKSIIVLFDLAVIPVLILIARSREIKPSNLIFYALNPLVLVFIAGEGHLDAVQIFFICLSLYCFMQKKDGWGFFTLGCAIMSKYYALILLPFIINSRNWKKVFWVLFPVLSYLPFAEPGTGLFSSLVTFGTTMHYNDSLTVLLRAMFGSHATLMSMFLLLTIFAIIFLVVHDPIKSGYLAFASLLLFTPTLHPWYLVLITPFLVFSPSRAWLYLHFAVVFTFPVLRVEYYTGVFQELHWLKAFEYLPFFALLVFDFFRQRPVSFHGPFRHAKDFSVVIPALNESGNIFNAIESVRKEKDVLETIVVDGGSSDSTMEIARNLGAKVVESEKGRGRQISEGVNQCQGDIILILHADCRILHGTFERIIKELKQKPQCIGGSLGMCYEFKSFKNLFLSFLNNLRARWAGISFGDQGQFVRKEALDTIGGFPDQMLMEDVELAMRFKENGAVCHISKGIMVSHRRWDEMGFYANFKKVVTLCSVYFINRRLGLGDARREGFYNRYYTAKKVLNVKS
ncbi:MAG: glycosyltransferase [Deltaproteobacteria bacterium]|nr:glycosyltransferase [Deltaproteobacteria bacterium]